MGSPRYVHLSTRPVCLSLRCFPNLTYSPLSSGAVASLPVVMRMHDDLCIGNRETEHGGARSDPETALLRYVVTYSMLIVHFYTYTRTTMGAHSADLQLQPGRFNLHVHPSNSTLLFLSISVASGSPTSYFTPHSK